MKDFEPINKGYNSVFQPNQLSVGIVVPIENYSQSPVPTIKHRFNSMDMDRTLEHLAEKVLHQFSKIKLKFFPRLPKSPSPQTITSDL